MSPHPKMGAATTLRKRIRNSQKGRNSIMKFIKTKVICSVWILFFVTSLGRGPLFAQDGKTVYESVDSGSPTSGLGAGHAVVSSGTMVEPLLHVGPGDLIEMKVFNVQQLGQDIRVNDQGDASINLIGSIHLAGLTTVQAQELIARRLQECNFVLNPHVPVMIREYGTQGISVLGDVKTPSVSQVLGNGSLL